MKLDRDFVTIFAGRILQAAVALLSIRLMTALLDHEAVGSYYLVFSVANCFSFIFINPVGMFLNRKIHQWDSDTSLGSAFHFLNLYFFAIALLSLPIVFVVHKFFGVGSQFATAGLVSLIFLMIYISTWFQTLCPSLNLLHHRRAFVVLNLAAQVIGLLLALVFVKWIQADALFWILGLLLGQGLAAIGAFLYFVKRISKAQVRASFAKGKELFWKLEVWHFCVPIALTAGLMWAQSQLYRVVVESELGPALLGTLGIGLGVASSIAGLIESVVSQYFYPAYYAKISNANLQDRKLAWRNLFLSSIGVYIPVMAFVACLAKPVLKLLVSSQFTDSVEIVIWGAGIEFLRLITNIFYIVSQSEMRTRSTILPYGAGAIILLGTLYMNIFVDKATASQHVPTILATSGLAVCLLMYFKMNQLFPLLIDWKKAGYALALALPFLAGILSWPLATDLINSFLICTAFGMYLLLALYLSVKKLRTFP